jgi:hypothetical protein
MRPASNGSSGTLATGSQRDGRDGIWIIHGAGRATWDVVLCADGLHRFAPQHALEILRVRGLEVPFVVVLDAIDKHRSGEMRSAGAHNCLIKKDLAWLAPVVRRELRDIADRSHRRHEEQQFTEAATAHEAAAIRRMAAQHTSARLAGGLEDRRNGRTATSLLRTYALAPILNILVPHTGHVPSVAGRPFFMVIGFAFLISRCVLHFMQ